MNIRTGTLDDLEAIVTIYKQTLNNMVNPHKIFKIYIKKGNCFVIEDEEVRGAMTFDINRMYNSYETKYGKDKFFWLEQLVVEPNYQGKGLGSKLMEYTIKQTNLQIRMICNIDKIEWYKRFGYVVYQTVMKNNREQAIMILEK